MSFLGNLFKTKDGGTVVGNLFRKATAFIPVVGPVVSGALTTIKEVSDQKNAVKAQAAATASGETTFAGQAATKEADGTYAMSSPLNEVNISTSRAKTEPVMPAWVDKIGDVLSNLGGRATEQTKVGVDNKTLMIFGGIGLAFVAVMAMNKK